MKQELVVDRGSWYPCSRFVDGAFFLMYIFLHVLFGVDYFCFSSQVLLTHRNSKDVVKKDFLLHEVCQYRARRCLKFLVEILPEQVNIADKKSMTPLHHALRGPRNHDSAVILLKSNAVFAPEIFETDNGGTLLIELFMSDDTSHLLELTQLMLEKGPPELATRVLKSDGDTALNKLLKFFGSSTPRDREQYIAEVTATIQLLISKVWSLFLFLACPVIWGHHFFSGYS